MPDTSLASPCARMKQRIEAGKKRVKDNRERVRQLRARLEKLRAEDPPNHDLIFEIEQNIVERKREIEEDEQSVADEEVDFGLFCSGF